MSPRLLNRTSRRLALTEFGRTIADSAIRLYREAEAAEGNAREMAARPKGLVRLAVPMSYELRWAKVEALAEFFLRRLCNPAWKFVEETRALP